MLKQDKRPSQAIVIGDKVNEAPTIAQQPINGQPSGLVPPKRSKQKIILWIIGTVVTSVLLLVLALFIWYTNELSPIGTDKNQRIQVTIIPGQTPSQIGQLLEVKKVIRSNLAFDIYTRFTNKRDNLQAGTYLLLPSDSTAAIVDHLVNGDVDESSITFYPGATLIDKSDTPESKKLDVRTALMRSGYNDAEITTAFNKNYDGPLFMGRPNGADIEGYVYGDTYRFNKDATVEQVLQRAFDKFYEVVKENDLIEKYKSHGLSLYQGITFASIVQSEAHNSNDQKQVAQVFYSRLSMGMQLGSDVTYQYIADKLGVARDTNLDSPYNTRRYAGLPPGPISTPGLSALLAVAEPAGGDYLYFLSGDDHKIYFAHTNDEHEANVKAHCQKQCSQL